MNSALEWQEIDTILLAKPKTRHYDVVTIVVTFNRKDLLIKCIHSLLNQTAKTDVLIVDNDSSDGTENVLLSSGLLDDERICYLRLSSNTGGAGGFYYGMKYALTKGWCWFWLMDDDAVPDCNALGNLLSAAKVNQNHIYGSVAIDLQGDSKKLCFPTKKIVNKKSFFIEDYDALSDQELISWLPFLGFFIHRSVVSKIGLPDRDLFIRNDDVEYSERAKKYGSKIYMIKKSIIRHPYQPTISFNFFEKKIYYRSMPPWKIYYEVRNKIIVSRKYYSILPSIVSFAGVTFQVLMGLVVEKNRYLYLRSFFRGIVDGIRFTPKVG